MQLIYGYLLGCFVTFFLIYGGYQLEENKKERRKRTMYNEEHEEEVEQRDIRDLIEEWSLTIFFVATLILFLVWISQ